MNREKMNRQTMQIQFGAKTIPFEVIYRKRKTMEIRVEPPDRVTVVAPQGTPHEVILQKVYGRASWIVQKLLLCRQIESRPIRREFVNGESFLYLGRNHSLQLILDASLKKPAVKLYRGKFYVTTPDQDEQKIRQAMEQWYRAKTLEKVKERVAYYQRYFEQKPAAIRVKEQKKRWASCTARDELLFNWRCVMAPAPVLDYIVVHEMCHMCHKNHSKAFWDLVTSILPDYQESKEWLKKYGVRMDL